MRIFALAAGFFALAACTAGVPNSPPPPSDILTADDLFHGDLVITEFVADAAIGCTDGDGEWIEVHNASGYTVNLDGLRFEDGQGNRTVIPEVFVANGGYALLGKGPAATWCALEVYPDGFYASSFYMNNNGPESLAIVTAGGSLIDQIPTFWDLGTVEGSVALDDRYIDAWDNDDGLNWYYTATCTDYEPFGSPGYANGTCDL